MLGFDHPTTQKCSDMRLQSMELCCLTFSAKRNFHYLGKKTFYYQRETHLFTLQVQSEVMLGTGDEGAVGGCDFSWADLYGEFLRPDVLPLALVRGRRAAPGER